MLAITSISLVLLISSPSQPLFYLPLSLQKDLVIYEMNVRAYTADESSRLDQKIRGSYLGVIEKVMVYHVKLNNILAKSC